MSHGYILKEKRREKEKKDERKEAWKEGWKILEEGKSLSGN